LAVCRKLETITGDLVLIGNYETKTLSLPALSNVTGGGLINGPFDSYVLFLPYPKPKPIIPTYIRPHRISFPSLKSIGYLIVKSTGDIDCVALGKNLSSLIFTPKEYDSGVGFTCWTPDEQNRYNSSDVAGSSGGSGSGNGSPTATGTAAAETSSDT